MKINIISVGNFKKNNSYHELFYEYLKRMNWQINLIETKNFICNTVQEQKNQEGKEIIKHLQAGYKNIVLDERGEIITTNKFAEICNKFNESNGGINFIIGGSDGLSQDVLNIANFTLSFGKMVYPHLMVRVMLIEQIYRVFTLNNNHPYHK